MDPIEALASYAEMLRSTPHNLMSPRGLGELEERHFPECTSLAMSLPRVSGGTQRLLDVGSGGGLPGVIIALIRPDLEVHLLEATSKKVAFLRDCAASLGLRLLVHHGRAEELGRTPLGGTFDLVTARAVAPMERLLGWTMPFLRPGGLLYAVKGDRWAEELEAASAALFRSGASIVATPEHAPPDAMVRSVIVARIAGSSPGREGM